MTGKEFDFSFDLNWRKGDIGLHGKITSNDCDDCNTMVVKIRISLFFRRGAENE